MKASLIATSGFAALLLVGVAATNALVSGSGSVGGSGSGGVGVDSGAGSASGSAGGTVEGAAGASAGTSGASATAGGSASASGSLSADDVDRDDPFGEIDIDQSSALSRANLNDDQVAELRERCEIIVSNRDTYDTTTVAWCEANADVMKN